jgi:hypothetical protein
MKNNKKESKFDVRLLRRYNEKMFVYLIWHPDN